MPLPPSWLHEAALQQFFAAVEDRGGQARAVGGCVRDFLLGRTGADVDIATSLLPDAVIELAHAKAWKAIPTGLSHGTVTLVLPQRVIEVTTLRCDVATNGRHAQVAFTDSFEQDAARRDFTMNALSMDFRGVISDYLGGEADLRAQRVRFIGVASERIREDALRILRFFRFLATHGAPPADAQAIAACASKCSMLDTLSGERIQKEMKKLLAAEDPSYALVQMSMMAMGERLCHAPWQVGLLPRLLLLEAQYALRPNPWVRLLSLLAPVHHIAAASHISGRWKLSRHDTQWLEFLTAPPPLQSIAEVKEALRHFPRAWVQDALLLRAVQDADRDSATLMPVVQDFVVPTFPLSAQDLIARGMTQGKALGDALRTLEQHWVQSDYRLAKDDLLGLL